MLKLKKIAITGGLASGKTTVCQFFKELGAYVVDADAIVHELLKPNTSLGQRLIQLFGLDILVNGSLSRKIIAEKAFQDPQQLSQLEKILHPEVFRRIEELYENACEANRYSSFVVEVPLLYEIGAEDAYDAVIVVLSDESEAKLRFEQRGYKQTEYAIRMSRQIEPDEKAKKTPYVIHNKGSLEDLKRQVFKMNQILHKH